MKCHSWLCEVLAVACTAAAAALCEEPAMSSGNPLFTLPMAKFTLVSMDAGVPALAGGGMVGGAVPPPPPPPPQAVTHNTNTSSEIRATGIQPPRNPIVL